MSMEKEYVEWRQHIVEKATKASHNKDAIPTALWPSWKDDLRQLVKLQVALAHGELIDIEKVTAWSQFKPKPQKLDLTGKSDAEKVAFRKAHEAKQVMIAKRRAPFMSVFLAKYTRALEAQNLLHHQKEFVLQRRARLAPTRTMSDTRSRTNRVNRVRRSASNPLHLPAHHATVFSPSPPPVPPPSSPPRPPRRSSQESKHVGVRSSPTTATIDRLERLERRPRPEEPLSMMDIVSFAETGDNEHDDDADDPDAIDLVTLYRLVTEDDAFIQRLTNHAKQLLEFKVQRLRQAIDRVVESSAAGEGGTKSTAATTTTSKGKKPKSKSGGANGDDGDDDPPPPTVDEVPRSIPPPRRQPPDVYVPKSEPVVVTATSPPSAPRKKKKTASPQTQVQGELAKAIVKVAKTLETTRENLTPSKMRKALSHAIASPIDGIASLTGDARADLRQWLAQQIFALSRSAAPFKGDYYLNIVLRGPAGSGKTKAANVIAHVFRALGVLGIGRLFETGPVNFVSPYQGRSAELTRERFLDALESILFIDEAYAIADCRDGSQPDGGPSAAGVSALTELVRLMDLYRAVSCVIVAGYERDMECFLRSNEGLRRRFGHDLTLPPYSARDLAQMFVAGADRRLKEAEFHPDTIADYEAQYVEMIVQRLMAYYKGGLGLLNNQAGDVDAAVSYFIARIAAAYRTPWSLTDPDARMRFLGLAWQDLVRRRKQSMLRSGDVFRILPVSASAWRRALKP